MRKNKKKTRRIFFIICITFIVIFLIYNYKDKLFIINKETVIGKHENNVEDILVENTYKDSDYDTLSGNTETQFASNNIEIQPHIDEETGEKYLTYEDFDVDGEIINGIEDDYPRIKKTHDVANGYGYTVKAMSSEYHIFRRNDITPVYIETNTNWNNATFFIHDEDINDLDTRTYQIFQIQSTEKNISITDRNILDKIEINTQTINIPQLSGYGNCLCIVYNENKKQFIRAGSNESSGNRQTDVFKINNDGEVLNEIQWDFDNISSIKLIPIPDQQLIIQSGKFITILPEEEYEQETSYFNRNILCKRSNTIIKNIIHETNNKELIGGPYLGFIRISNVADVKLQDSKLYSYKFKEKSSYDLHIEYSTNIMIDNVTSNDIEDANRWGITGTNYTKDITYKNCALNRIDAHCGVHNLTIEDTTVGTKGLLLVGNGKLNLRNVTRIGGNYFIELREDYGSTWNGDINITNCTLKRTKSNKIIYFKTTYNNGEPHDYGYDLYLPNVYIDGLKIDDSNISQDNENLYIFYNGSSETGIENGDMRNNYNLPQNIIVKNYETTSGRKLKLFYNKFYNSLDELGINLSMPLSDKEKVNILTSDNETVENDLVTNKDIKIASTDVEGIETIVKVNGDIIGKDETISNEGNYAIEVTYRNTAGESEIENTNVTIDKTAPKITGVDNDVTYYKPITLNSTDTDIKELNVYRNEEKIEYTLGEEISEIGDYTIEVSDNAGNTNNTKFEIAPEFELEGENYTIVNNNYIIVNIDEIDIETLKTSLKNNVKYNVYRDEEELENEEIIVTGDIIATENNNKYYLIIKGDNNSDGIFDITDLLMFKRYLIHMVEFDEFSQKSMDLNTDGVTDITDLLITKRTLINAI